MANKSDFREFSRQDRYRAMEVLLNWEGGCNASRLGRLFNVRRENVTRYIQDYRETYPGQMWYDSVCKIFKPTTTFTPKCTRGIISEYIDFARRFPAEHSGSFNGGNWLDCGPRPHIEPEPSVFRTIVQAIKECQIIAVRYRSWNHPSGRDRKVHPHALAYSGLRWHCRAFDEETQSYRDFHLGRFESIALVGKAGDAITGEADHDWHQQVDLLLIPNPELSEQEQQLVRADYSMDRGCLTVRSRRAMAQYVLTNYHVSPNGDIPENPRQQPLVCANLDIVASVLF
jgi:predicted DNA-binding transcriptional regulator YafY